jgi:Fe-S-cluster-containing hydrogenase component 2/rubredoxin
MSERYAVRNIRLCTKDCLCLYVCPTGATDTENSVIDIARCNGCGVCADACPSKAISMVPKDYPPQQNKTEKTVETMRKLARGKAQAEALATALPGKLAAALERSNRILLEDLLREAGYMLPQSDNARHFLLTVLERETSPAFPKAAAEALLRSTRWSESEKQGSSERWKCGVCGYIHEGALPQDFVCPRCKQPAGVFIGLSE